MRRLNHHKIRDCRQLSKILDELIDLLGNSFPGVSQKSLAWEAHIPEHLLSTLRGLHLEDECPKGVLPEDLHTVLSNILFRFPTVKLWRNRAGHICFEI